MIRADIPSPATRIRWDNPTSVEANHIFEKRVKLSRAGGQRGDRMCPKRRRRATSLPFRSPMAVPKQKQSHARTNQRRSQHKIARADAEHLPAVPPAASPAPRVPALRRLRRSRGHGGRARRSRSRARPLGAAERMAGRVTVALDANGADLGPGEVARGAALAAGRGDPRAAVRAGGASSATRCPRASRSSTRRSRSPRPRTPPARSARRRSPRSSRPSARSPAAGPTRWSRAARPASPSPPACSRSSAPAACTVPRWRSSSPPPGRRSCCSTSAPTSRCGPSTSCSSRTWAPRSCRRSAGIERPRVALLSNGEEPTRGPEDVVAAHAELAAARELQLRRQRRRLRGRHRRRRRHRCRRLSPATSR